MSSLRWKLRNEMTDITSFFSIKKAGGKRNRHIEMWIESAYRQENSPYAPPHRPNPVRFKVLIQNVFMGRPLNFAPR